MVATCKHCQKYIFDVQNFSRKRMTVREYIEGVVRRYMRTNKEDIEISELLGYKLNWLVNQAACELCGAPHAVFSSQDHNDVLHIAFFFSGDVKPSEKDMRFIQDYRENLV